MEINGIKLDDAKVAACRAAFERARKKGWLTFDQLLDRFATNVKSIAEIAREHGVSRQIMSLYYNRHFRDLLPDAPSIRQRHNISSLTNVQSRGHMLSDHAITAFVMTEAQRFGYEPRQIQRGSTESMENGRAIFYDLKLMIQNKICLINFSSSPRSTSPHTTKQTYSSFYIRTYQPCDFRILVVKISEELKRVYVVPADLLVVGKCYFIPTTSCPDYHKTFDAIDWRQYENAWHLLKAQQ